MAASCDFEPKLLMESTYTCQRRMGEGQTGAHSPPQAHSPPTFLLLLQPLQIRGVQRIPHEVSQPDEGFRNQGGESWSPEISERPPPAPLTQVCLLGQDPVLWAVLSILFHQNLSFLLTSKGMRTGETVWRDPSQAAPRLCHWLVK